MEEIRMAKGKKIIALNGSYRKKGNTYHMVEEVLNGCKDAGAKTEHIMLMDENINACLGCSKCFVFKDEIIGKCVQKDGTRELLKKIIDADALIVACPIYWGNISSHMTKLMHRMIALTYDKGLDGGLKGVPVYKLKQTKPGMFVTSMVAPFPINYLMGGYRHFYGFLKNILKICGYKSTYVLNVGGSEGKTPIPEREKMKKKAFKLGVKLAGG